MQRDNILNRSNEGGSYGAVTIEDICKLTANGDVDMPCSGDAQVIAINFRDMPTDLPEEEKLNPAEIDILMH